MIAYALGFFLIFLGLWALALQRLYSSVPARELKRLAGRNDQLAAALYRVAAYGASARLLLWLVLGVALSLGFLLIISNVAPAVSFIVLTVVSLAAFVWLPSLRLTQRSAQFAAWCSPALAWLLVRVHGPFDRVSTFVNRYRELPGAHSRLYEKEDLLALLEQQKEQPDNRIQAADLELARRALRFADRQVSDLLLPRKQTHLVNADDTIGPVLLDQLHKQQQTVFLVYKDDKDNIIGVLNMSDAVRAKQGGRVFDLVRSDLIFVHEDFSLRQALEAFQQTGQSLASVINEFEEFIGVISLDSVLQELLGEMDNEHLPYENRNAIAAYQSSKSQSAEAPEVSEQAEGALSTEGPSPEVTEVIE